MSRSTLRRSALAAALLLAGISVPTSARAVHALAICPASANAGSQVQVQLRIENPEPSPLSARVLSTVVGNSGDNLAGIGVFGPFVAAAQVTIPAAIVMDDPNDPYDDHYPPVDPGVENLVLNVPPALPSALSGTVATLLLLVEVDGPEGDSKLADAAECLIEVL